tara:strand:+ start:35 stop:550 length:516 start_codon:yes stop_codon:yes gene_type:complete
MDKKKSSKSNYFIDTACKKFRETALSKNYKLKMPSAGQKAQHIDFIMFGQSQNKTTVSVTLDVKCKTDSNSDKWQWIELKNSKGKPGWLYQEADFVIFERKKDFLLVNRKNLVNWLNLTNKVRYDLPTVSQPWQAKYRLYTRPDKKEVITQIQSADLLDIDGTQIWPKDLS